MHRFRALMVRPTILVAAIAVLPFIALQTSKAFAATVCVNPGGTGGCKAKIADAVSAASPNDTIQVAPGIYKESVTITKPLALVGAGVNRTTIDATGLSTGIYIDGLDNRGLSSVLVTGFTVENANYEGILATNSSSLTIWGNNVINNNKNLSGNAAACPGIPAFETAEDFDCGEGIHLSGVSFSTVSRNVVQRNAGGILLSDDTGVTQNNLISGNTVQDNGSDCGITLASHPPATSTGATSPFGVTGNTIAGNTSARNGLKTPGAGAGVGLFTPVPGGRVSGNVVIGNQLLNNGLPGVAFHSHAPQQDITNNTIVANRISGNGKDTEDAATTGPTGINVFGVSALSGTVISENVISGEAVDIAVKTPANIDVHLNNLTGTGIGLANGGTGKVNASGNWWGFSGGPGVPGCSQVNGSGVSFAPPLGAPF